MENGNRVCRNLKVIGLTFLVCTLIWLPVGLYLNLPRGYVIGSSGGMLIGIGLGYLILKAIIENKAKS